MTFGAHALTQEEILGASIRLMQQRGFTALGMRDIAAHLKIKAPSLYHHFPSKDVLAQQALRQYRQEQSVRLQALEQRQTLSARLLGYAQLFSSMLRDEGRLCLYIVLSEERAWIPAPCVAELRQFVEQNVDWLANTLQVTGTRDTPHLCVSARATAEILFGAFEGFMTMSVSEKDPDKIFLARAQNLLRALGLAPSKSARASSRNRPRSAR